MCIRDRLIKESDDYLLANTDKEDIVSGLISDQEKLTGSGEKLAKLNNLKGKISQKVSTITKEHKFFTDNVS